MPYLTLNYFKDLFFYFSTNNYYNEYFWFLSFVLINLKVFVFTFLNNLFFFSIVNHHNIFSNENLIKAIIVIKIFILIETFISSYNIMFFFFKLNLELLIMDDYIDDNFIFKIISVKADDRFIDKTLIINNS